jgi:hypothetical protein
MSWTLCCNTSCLLHAGTGYQTTTKEFIDSLAAIKSILQTSWVFATKRMADEMRIEKGNSNYARLHFSLASAKKN